MTGREEWLAWRQQGIGASDIAGILGISPWASPWSVWADKVGLLPPEPDNEHMAAGRWLEAAIGPWFTHETGLDVAGEQTWCSHPIHPHHRCTVDGFVLDGAVDGWEGTEYAGPEHALGLLEVKVTGPGRRWETIPAHYQAQGQWQMHVTDLSRVWFAVLMGRRLDVHELDRDDDDIAYMAERADAFWTDHVLGGTPPDTDGHDATLRALAAVYAKSSPGAIPLGSDDMSNVMAWRDAKAAEKAATRDAKAAAAAIEATLADAEEGTWQDRRIVSWRPQTRKTTCRACGHTVESDPFRVLRYHAPKETP